MPLSVRRFYINAIAHSSVVPPPVSGIPPDIVRAWHSFPCMLTLHANEIAGLNFQGHAFRPLITAGMDKENKAGLLHVANFGHYGWRIACSQQIGGYFWPGMITTVSPPVLPGSPLLPCAPVSPVWPVAPFAPSYPAAPVSPFAPS